MTHQEIILFPQNLIDELIKDDYLGMPEMFITMVNKKKKAENVHNTSDHQTNTRNHANRILSCLV